MTTWSVTLTHRGGVEIYSGAARTPTRAREAALAAARDRHHKVVVAPGNRYTLHIDGQVVAILAGVDESADAHAEVDELFERLAAPPIPPVLDFAGMLSAVSPLR